MENVNLTPAVDVNVNNAPSINALVSKSVKGSSKSTNKGKAKAKSANKSKAKSANKTAVPYTKRIEELITAGGTWEHLLAEAAKIAKTYKCVAANKVYFKSLIAYRRKSNASFAQGVEVTETGLSYKTK